MGALADTIRRLRRLAEKRKEQGRKLLGLGSPACRAVTQSASPSEGTRSMLELRIKTGS